MLKSNNLNTIIIDFLSGGISGSIAKTITAPLEVVKLIKQTESHDKLTKRGILSSLKKIINEKGILTLWRGNLSNLLRYFPLQAINFSVKEQIDNIINYKFIKNPDLIKKNPYEFLIRKLTCGGLTGAIGLLCVYPLDFTRTRLGIDVHKQFNGIFHCLKTIIQKEGIKGIYRGFGISIFGIIIYRSFYFGLYDFGKKFLLHENSSLIQKFLIAQSVSIISENISYPIDTIRRRLMVESGKSDNDKKFKSAFDCAKFIYKENGYKGFYKGLKANIFRSLSSSLVLVLYDEINQFMKKKNRKLL